MHGGTQWNSTLKRRTPLRAKRFPEKFRKEQAKKEIKRTAGIKRQSDKAAKRHREYMPIQREVVREWQESGTPCSVCVARGINPPNAATEVHHLRGRRKSLLTDRRNMVPSCGPCRLFPHDNPKWARAAGVISERRDWGVEFPAEK